MENISDLGGLSKQLKNELVGLLNFQSVGVNALPRSDKSRTAENVEFIESPGKLGDTGIDAAPKG